MAINVIVQYNGGFLSDILLLTQAPIFVYGSMTLLSYIISTLLIMYYIVFCFVMLGGSACRLILVYSITVGFSPTLYRPTRCFNFGLSRIHQYDCMFELNF